MITTVRNSAQLLKALKAAHSGDTILLATGTYDAVAITGLNFASDVTIESADPTHEAVLSNLTVSNSFGLNFQQLTLSATTGTAVTVSGSQNISFSQDTFTGASSTSGNAMMLRSSSNISVMGSNFANFGTGINVLTDSNLTITNNTFHAISGGAIRGTGVTASTISGNTFTDASTTVPTHTDVVYLWQDNTANQVTITNNFYGPPLPAVLTTATQLVEALQNAHAGDVIQLAAGAYAGVNLSNYQFASAVTITSADPTHQAVLTDLTVSGSSGLTFQGVTLSTATGTAATVASSQGITFSHDTFTGPGASTGSAMMVNSASGVTVTGSDFGNFGAGINAATDSNLTITNNTFHDISGDDVRGTGVTNSTISGNTFANASATVPTHTDVLYLLQDNTANNVAISNNVYGSPTPAGPVLAPTQQPVAGNIVTVSNVQQLETALANAHAGDVIELAAGVYSAPGFYNSFTTPVTITSADPNNHAVLQDVDINGASGITFADLTLSTATGTAVHVANGSNLLFSHDAFSGPSDTTGTAMTLVSSSGVTVTGSDFDHFNMGFNLSTDNGLTVSNNTFEDIGGGAALAGRGVTNSTISGNDFSYANPTATNHSDAVSLWQDNTANNVTISGNTYGSGATAVTDSSVSAAQTTSSVSSTTTTSTATPPAPVLTPTQQLVADLQNAHAGDVIQLAAGTYDGAVLNNLQFATGVTITSADPTHEAVISNLTVSNSSGLVFEGVTLTTSSGTAATVTGSHAITFSQDTFSGPGAGTGVALAVSGSSGVAVTGSDIGNFGTGLNLQTDSNVTVIGNNFHGNPGGGVVGAGVTTSVINGNTFPDASSTNTTHTDVINLSQDNTANQVEINGNAYGSAHIVMVSSVQQLETALANAHGGDVIELAAGVYSAPGFYNSFTTPVTIMSADPNNHAVLQDVDINGASGVTFADLTLSTATGTAVHVANGSNLLFSHDAFSGPSDTTSTAMTLGSSSGVTVTGSDFDHFNMGFNLSTDNGLTVSNNTFEDIGGGAALAGRGITNSTISGNDFSYANPTVTGHTDAISLWQDNTANNVAISGNTYGSGATAVTDSSISTPQTTSSVSSTTTTSTITSSAPASTTPVVTAPNVVTVNSTQGLMNALYAAQSGEVIKLAAGSYGDLGLWGLHFSGAGVTITSADQSNEAVVSSINTDSTTGLNIDHLKVQMAAGNTGPAVQLINGSNVNVSYLTIAGTGTSGAYNGTGVLVRNETGASVTHSDFGQLNIGINATDANNVTLSNNTVHDLSQDGIDSSGSSNVVVQGNSFTNFTPGYGVHPDAIQFSADGSGVHGSNILVEDNVITRGTGAIFQGIFVENTGHIEITGNAMAGTMYNGISLSTTDTGLVSNNFVEGFTDMTSWIITRNVSSNVSVINNDVTAIQNYADGGVANPNYSESGTVFIPQANVGDYTAMNAWLAQHAPSTASLSDSFFLH